MLDAMRRLHEANVPALTEEEIAAEVQEVRAVQRATREAGHPDDNHVIACAVAAQAETIVSGDGDLLALKEYEGIRIISAAEAVKLFTLS